ncbi:TetR/AcrR family transcriptional regulator [Rhodopila sp.]|uniref:TetR/AcrR family transcriptional regulator n=1 Tax=Rhodopila sp. TaxID=2480087 RepID=UPI003D1386CA
MDQIATTNWPRASGSAPGERARTRILDTAEALFAEAGPAAVTLRSIAAAADVNVAAVNYYFGSKEKLFEEMFVRRIVPLNEERLVRLTACSEAAGGMPTLEDIVTAFVAPALQLTDAANASARAIVVQYSLGRVLALPEVNQMLVRYYARVREAFVAAVQRAVPYLAPHEVIWRYYWMGGSVMVALAVPPGMVEAPGGTVGSAGQARHHTMQGELIAFLVQGIRASSGAGAGLPGSGAAVSIRGV